MPFDNTREHPHQRLLDLEEKLRKGDFTFTWNFGSFSHCAAAIDCLNEDSSVKTYEQIAEYYWITADEARGIFSAAWNFHGGEGIRAPCRDITPEIVANTIRKILEEKVYAYAPR